MEDKMKKMGMGEESKPKGFSIFVDDLRGVTERMGGFPDFNVCPHACSGLFFREIAVNADLPKGQATLNLA